MPDNNVTDKTGSERDDFCDIRVWSGDCEFTSSLYSGGKYLCDICGTIPELEPGVELT